MITKPITIIRQFATGVLPLLILKQGRLRIVLLLLVVMFTGQVEADDYTYSSIPAMKTFTDTGSGTITERAIDYNNESLAGGTTSYDRGHFGATLYNTAYSQGKLVLAFQMKKSSGYFVNGNSGKVFAIDEHYGDVYAQSFSISNSTTDKINFRVRYNDFTGTRTFTFLLITSDKKYKQYGGKISVTGSKGTMPPTVQTTSVTNVTSNSAKFKGIVNPNGSSTTYYFKYGPNSSMSQKTTSKNLSSSAGETTVTATVSGLSSNTLYYFQLYAENEGGSSKGDSFTFTTEEEPNNPPAPPTSPSPSVNSHDVSTSGTLSWSCSDPEGDPITYKVYLGTSESNMTLYKSTSVKSCSYSLDPAIHYFWYVIASDGKQSSTSQVWNFTTKSDLSKPTDPSPANNATDVGTSGSFSWSSDNSGSNIKYNIYLGTSSVGLVKIATTTNTSFSYSGLVEDANYFWKVIATDGEQEASSSLWHFNTVLGDCFDGDDVNSFTDNVLGRPDGTDGSEYTFDFDANNDNTIDIEDVVQVISMITDIQQGNLPKTDEENEGGFENPTETEQQVMQMPSDEEGTSEIVYAAADSLEYDAMAQEVIRMYDTDDDDDYDMSELNMSRRSVGNLAEDIIRNNGKNIFSNQLIIEQQHWDSKIWGNTRYGGFKTFYSTQKKDGKRYLLVVFYYKGGFPNKKTAYLKLGQLNSGKIISKATISTGQEYSVLRVCIDDYLQNYGCFNVYPLLITETSKARNYLNPFMVKANPIVANNWRDKDYGYEFGKINGVSVYCNTSPQKKNEGGKGYVYQCVELCKRYVSELNSNIKSNELRGNAIDWPANRANDGRFLVFANDGLERVREGDLIVWNHGAAGHIGVVIKTTKDYISVAHQNGGTGTYALPIGSTMKLENGIIKDIKPGTNRSPIYKNIQTVPYFIRINNAAEHRVSYDASMSASTTNIKFSPTQVGKSVTQTFKIANSKGVDALTVSSISLSKGDAFSIDVTNCIIQPGEVRSVEVTFTPSVSGNYKDRVIIRSDADDNPIWVIQLSGSGT